VWRFFKNLKIELPYDLVILLLGIYPKERKTGYNKDTCTPKFIVALFTIAKLWKHLGSLQLMNGPVKCGIHIMEYYSDIRNNNMWFEGKWIQLQHMMISDVRQAQKHKDHMFSPVCGRQIQKISIYTKTSMIIYKVRYRICL
jgi:hypothetical protein